MSSTLQIDRDAREIFNEAAIAHGMHDAELALAVCEKLTRIEPHYELRFRDGDGRASNEASPKNEGPSLRKMPAKFPGRCAKCARGIAVGSTIAYDAASKRAFHEECAS